ncbi:MAG TPA: type II toxin-antitoxin system antitoxin SocA domain-containing protein [Polyangia bacterium]
MITALETAKYLLTLDDPEDGDLTSNLKLQKLLYYAQGVHLALHSRPLFGERIEAWKHGPVCPPVYGRFKAYASTPIPRPAGFDPSTLPKPARATVTDVHRVYGQFSAWRLREMTHNEPPWKSTYRDGAMGLVISHEAMKKYFLTCLR